MSRFHGALAWASMLSCASLATATALAHIDLLEPAARAAGRPDTRLLRAPCGQVPNARRDDRVSVFRPGETIEVTWDVYVQHQSYFRVSFDADGDDSFSTRPSAPSDPAADDPTLLPAGEGEIILDYVKDLAAEAEHIERSVTLPNIECDRCTLQLTQFTYGLPLRDAIYYQCADLVLDAGDGDGEVESSAGSGGRAGGPAREADTALGPDAKGAGCSLAPGAAREHALRWGWLLGLALCARRRAQGVGSDSIHSRSSST